LAIDDYAVKSLEAIKAKDSEQSIFSVILFPFGAPSNSRGQLLDTFNQAAGVMEMQLKRLVRLLPREGTARPTICQIDMATATSIDLNELEEQLGVIHDIVTREQHQNKRQTDQLVGYNTYLWQLRPDPDQLCSWKDFGLS
jgi:hypothetical protein